MRAGIGKSWRLGVEAHNSPNFRVDTLSRSERLNKNPTGQRQGCDFPEGWNGLSVRGARRLGCSLLTRTSRLADPSALPGATIAAHRVAGSKTRPADALPVR